MQSFTGFTSLLLFFFAAVAGVLWFLLPFAVFGIKSRIAEAINEAKAANALLKQIADQQRELIERGRHGRDANG